MDNLKNELDIIENEYKKVKQLNFNLKNILNKKYDPNINEIIKNSKQLLIENRYISVKNYNVNNLNNKFEIENTKLLTFNIDEWNQMIKELHFEIQELKKEIYCISEDLY